MKTTNYILLCAGFVIAAYATALDVVAVNWGLFGVAAVASAAGVYLLKRQASALARSDERLAGNRRELEESIDNVVRDLGELVSRNAAHEDGIRDYIDAKLSPDLRRFTEARESMVHLFGLQAYADIMSQFAAGERYVNRVWSASADGYLEEAARYLNKASEQFKTAQAHLHEVMASETQGRR